MHLFVSRFSPKFLQVTSAVVARCGVCGQSGHTMAECKVALGFTFSFSTFTLDFKHTLLQGLEDASSKDNGDEPASIAPRKPFEFAHMSILRYVSRFCASCDLVCGFHDLPSESTSTTRCDKEITVVWVNLIWSGSLTTSFSWFALCK